MSQATTSQMNEFVQVVDKFMLNYARLISSENRQTVYASGNPQLISDYETAVSRGGILKSTIDRTVGAWSAAKRGWQSVTDVTSMYIGDAADWLKNLFGGNSGVGGLGAIQIPAAIWVSGIVASAYLLNSLMTKIFISIEATKIERNNPGISRSDALQRASNVFASGFFDSMNVPLLAAAALIGVYLWKQK